VVVNPNDDVREGAEVKPASGKQKNTQTNGASDRNPSGVGASTPPPAASKAGNKK